MRKLLLLALTSAVGFALHADLETGFKVPPASAKPHTWFHMMNGNVTKEGITRDFEELAGIGIGGVQMFDAGCDVPAGGLDFNSPAWFDMFKHAAGEARRLGLEICIPNCSGWSSSGGPWNRPENGMKETTIRKTAVKGPMKFHAKLDRETNDHGFYRDIGVFAFPTPVAEHAEIEGVETKIEADAAVMSSAVPFEAAGFSYTLDYPGTWVADADVAVEISEDGKEFRPFEKFRVPLVRSGHGGHSFFHSFPKKLKLKGIRVSVPWASVKTTVKEARPEKRMELFNLPAKTFAVRQEVTIDHAETTPDQVVAKAEVRDITDKMAADGTLDWQVPAGEWTIMRIGYLCNGRGNHPASKHGWGLEVDKLSAEAMDYHFEQYVAKLCRTLGPLAGRVDTGFNNILVDSYEVGSQNWTQKMETEFKQRCGYSLRPYLPVFAGFVVDDVATSERFLEDFRRTVADLFAENYAGALTKKCHEYGLRCSIEPYGSCPADNLQYGEYCDIPMCEFWSNAKRPYDASSGNAKFVSYVAHVWGKKYCASESFTAAPSWCSGRWMTTPASLKVQCDRAYANGVNRIIYHRYTHQPWADDKYLPGMTMGRWGMHFDRNQTWWKQSKPWIKYQTRCQYLLQEGVFCADVLFFAGEEAPNQGGNTDGGNGSGDFYQLPAGYDHDICPADAMYRLKVENGFVVAPGGVKYRILAMPPMEACSPKMMAQVLKLREAGATVVWPKKPLRSPGLRGGAKADAEVSTLADKLWKKGVMECTPAAALEKLGITPDCRMETKNAPELSWIHRRDDTADWYFTALPNPDETTVELSFRETGRLPELWDAETGRCEPAAVWREENGRTFVSVPYTVNGSKFVVFRKPVAGVHLEKCEVSAQRGNDPVPDYEWRGGKLYAWRPLDAKLSESNGAIEELRANPPPAKEITGAWEVCFPHGFLPNKLAKGAVEKVRFDRLKSWSESENEGVKYFSGSAVYLKTLEPVTLSEGARLVLDLGRVHEFAEVMVNGKKLGTLWKAPFRVDITDAIKSGEKIDLRIRVTNLWANRLIGDDRQFADDCTWKGEKRGGIKEIGVTEIPGWVKEGKKSPTGRCTFTTWKHWDKDDELQPSGIIGPVRLRTLVPAEHVGVPKFSSTTFTEGRDWARLDFNRRTIPGSPLDFSFLLDAPAGKYGFLKAGGDGHGIFEKAPEKRPRFYGGNFSWDAAVIEKAEADKVADELVRLGYNWVRAHQTDVCFRASGSKDSTELNPVQFDKFEYFLAAMRKRGIYYTLDCYSSRAFLEGDEGLAQCAGKLGEMKRQLGKNPAAMENWKKFTRNLLSHVNPYTGLALKDDPALIVLNLVNEDNRPFEEAEAQMAVHREQLRFLREEVGTKCFLTSLNMASAPAYTVRRSIFDVVDLHTYLAHPDYGGEKLKHPNVFQSNLSKFPPCDGGIWRDHFFQRIWGKPCVSTELRQCMPNVFRSEAGPMVGAYGALQDWDALMGYAYAEGAASLRERNWNLNPFDTANDPLSLFGEKITMLLYCRGDVKTAREKLCVTVPADALKHKEFSNSMAIPAAGLGLIHATGSICGEAPQGTTGVPFGELADYAKARLPSDGVYVSDTGEITLDTKMRTLKVVTPRSETLTLSGGELAGDFLKVSKVKAPVTVSAHSLDMKPLRESKSVLVFHLSDSANTGESFADFSMHTELAAGKGPMLVRRDEVTAHVGTGWKVTALHCDGSAAGNVPVDADGNCRLKTDGFPGGVLAYHLTR